MSPLFSRHKKIVLKMLGWFFVTKENNGKGWVKENMEKATNIAIP